MQGILFDSRKKMHKCWIPLCSKERKQGRVRDSHQRQCSMGHKKILINNYIMSLFSFFKRIYKRENIKKNEINLWTTLNNQII